MKTKNDRFSRLASLALKTGLQVHLEETQNQFKRLEQVLKLLGEPVKGKMCEAMECLIEEGKEAIEADTDNDSVRDALIICAAQKVEHYEIATYLSYLALRFNGATSALHEGSVGKTVAAVKPQDSDYFVLKPKQILFNHLS